MHRLVAAVAALATGGALAAALIVAQHSAPAGRQALVAARDLPAGAAVTQDSVRHLTLSAGAGLAAVLLPARELGPDLRTTHALAAGQLLQRTDVAAAAETELRLVLLPIKDAPAVVPGDRVDLLAVSAAGDHAVVRPFLHGVEVRGLSPSGVVLAVSARVAPALVYAAATQRMVLLAGAGARAAEEPAVASLDEALREVNR